MMILGGAGSLGTQLVKFYLKDYRLIIVSRDEAKHWKLVNKFKNCHQLTTIIGDVRDINRVEEIFLQEQPDIIIIAHALKQVDICEKFPQESVKTNILGTANIINSLTKLSQLHIFSPEAVCFISTDKACNPLSLYGMCKSISEKLILSAAQNTIKTKFVIVRYGNILSSEGSIVPLLSQQAQNHHVTSFTLTDPKMTRFIMTLEESVRLIDTAMEKGENGDLWVPQLFSMKILDLINYFSKKYQKPYKVIGSRPGEKIHEIMLTSEEIAKVYIKDNYFVFNNKNKIQNLLSQEYSSSTHLIEANQLELFMDQLLSN